MVAVRNRWWLVGLLAWGCVLPSGVSVAAGPPAPALSLPGLGDGAGIALVAERRLGDQIARSLYRDPDYLDDPVLGDYLDSLWQPLLAAARARGDVPPELAERFAWTLLLSRDRRVNAFALPGAYFGVHLGLVGITQSSAELASVLAHELSHVSQRHIARLLGRQEQMAPWLIGAMVLAALSARASADVVNATLVGGQAVAMQSQLNFSRDMEREADRVGFSVLTEAGFEGQGFVDMFEQLQQATRLNDDGAFPYLRSHPLSTERMADMRARLPWVNAAGGQSTPPPAQVQAAQALHPLMAARARVLAETGSDRWPVWLQAGQAATATPAERYAAAWSAMRLGQHARALALAQQLRTEVPAAAHAVADALWLELLLQAPPVSGPPAAARAETLAQLRERALVHGSRSMTLLGAQAALATAAAPQAATVLHAWVVQHPTDARAWQTLAQAYQTQGQTLRAVRAEAESRAAQLDYAGAVERLKAAQNLPAAQRAADPVELAIVDSRLRTLEGLLRESLLPAS
ncbi:MAG: repeat-containing protein YfgC precursor [Pseudomonadota bacterium]